MRHYFVINDTNKQHGHPTVLEDYKHLFIRCDWHEENGTIVASIAFPDEGHLNIFQQHPKVELMPHLLSRDPIANHHADKMAHYGIRRGHSTFDAALRFREKHPLMGPAVY